MGHRVARSDGEVVGLVGVVLVIGVEGADPDLLVSRQVVDLNRLAGEGIGAAVERGDTSMERSQFAEGLDPRARLRTAGADELVLEAASDGAQLRRGSGVGHDAISRGREGGTRVRRRSVRWRRLLGRLGRGRLRGRLGRGRLLGRLGWGRRRSLVGWSRRRLLLLDWRRRRLLLLVWRRWWRRLFVTGWRRRVLG